MLPQYSLLGVLSIEKKCADWGPRKILVRVGEWKVTPVLFLIPNPSCFLQLTNSISAVGIPFFVVQTIDGHVVQQQQKANVRNRKRARTPMTLFQCLNPAIPEANSTSGFPSFLSQYPLSLKLIS